MTQNFEPRLERAETDITEIKRAISELRSTVATLAEIAGIHDGQIERLIQAQAESQRLHDELAVRSDRDRALMLQLIQNLAQGGNGGN
jgi:prefoldin subunit 5